MVGEDMLGVGWGVHYPAYRCRPPDPAIVGDRWRDMRMERLKNVDYYPLNWLSHQHRDAYWKHASINKGCGNYGAIQCPVYAVGGWFDAYRRTVARMPTSMSA
ncbi:MAG: hypothetical protein E5V25_08690 [Mesorhizobium sp.]|nr:MAG: hypothetical protein E5V25_08690 [Mesorhizobium sp.]